MANDLALPQTYCLRYIEPSKTTSKCGVALGCAAERYLAARHGTDAELLQGTNRAARDARMLATRVVHLQTPNYSPLPIAPGKERSPPPPWDPSFSGAFFALQPGYSIRNLLRVRAPTKAMLRCPSG